MVPANSWKRPEILVDEFPAFSLKATYALQRILAETNAQIILTTSHKGKYSISQWADIFSLSGIKVKEVLRLPENTTNLSRKEEILHWFETQDFPDNFVIIDDDKSLNDLPKFLKDKLILTSGAIGLTDDFADRAIALLREEPILAIQERDGIRRN